MFPMSEKSESLREQLDREVPDWLDQVERTEPETTKSESLRTVRTLASLLQPADDRQFVQHPEEAEIPPEDVEIVVHMGCHSAKTPVIIDSIMDILDELAYDAVALGGHNNCCGIEDMKRGDIETAEKLDSNRFENIDAFDPDYAVAECSSCHAVTQTASLGYRSADFEFPFLPEFLNDHRERFLDRVEVSDPVTVTFHDHFDYRGWMPDEQSETIRDLFSSLPGVDIVEMEHTRSERLPCNLAVAPDDHPYDDINRQIYREAEAAGADVLIDIFHGCHRSLLRYDHEFSTTTKNYATFLAERLGFEYRDKNRAYFRAAATGDVDAIIEDARPVFEANGLSETEARSIVDAHY